jgi:hypothetical protein
MLIVESCWFKASEQSGKRNFTLSPAKFSMQCTSLFEQFD